MKNVVMDFRAGPSSANTQTILTDDGSAFFGNPFSGFRVQGFSCQGFGIKLEVLGFRCQGFRFQVQGLDCRGY